MDNATTVKKPLVIAIVIPNIKFNRLKLYLSSLTFRKKYPNIAPKGCERPPKIALKETALTLANLEVSAIEKYNGKHIEKPSVKLCNVKLINMETPNVGFVSDVI